MESAESDQEDKNPGKARKLMWKHLKQQMKEAKKSKKEEEFLACLRKPKDTKVVLADKSFFEKLRNQNAPPSTSRTPGFQVEDFPALSPSAPFHKSSESKKPMTYNKAVNNSMREWYFPPITNTTEMKLEQNSSDGLSSDTTSTLETATIKTINIYPERTVDAGDTKSVGINFAAPVKPQKQTKKKDPIVLSIEDLICSQKKPSKNDRNTVFHGSKYRRIAQVVLSGNMLDSSNPIRKRGKYREIKKVKLSKLKLAIIRDRILKQKGRDKSKEEIMDSKQFKIELDEYLSNLTKKKLELAEQRRKLSEDTKTEEIIPGEPKEEKIVKKKPTKYREYCDNSFTEGLDESVRNLVTGIVYLQDRAFNKDAIKAKAKQRHVVGFREVKKYLMLKKVKMVVVAPDLEAKDAVYDVVEDLKKTASLQNVPCVFALSRRMLGRAAKKPVPVSAFGIINYDGLEDKFFDVKEKLKIAQDKYKLDKSENLKTETASPVIHKCKNTEG